MLAKEVVDLSEPDRILMMDLRRQVEHVVREVTQPGKGSVSITAIEPVGHYAIRIVFSDGHDSGIYSWDLLQSFCQNQPRLWDEYLGKLLAAGHPRESGRDAPMVKSGGSGCAV